LAFFVCAGAVLALPACASDGHFSILGYTTAPNYANFRTVRVPIFENRTYRPRLEFDLTEAVIREIEKTIPNCKVVHAGQTADTELLGTIVSVTHGVLNRTPINQVREVETNVAVELIWRDLRTGEILSKPPRRPGQPLPPEALSTGPLMNALNPNIPAVPTAPPNGPVASGDAANAAKITIRSVAGFIPELGQSQATAYQQNVDRLAVEIVSMMEKPW
jgi:hypothetical protein